MEEGRRVEFLETKVSHQERVIADLSSELYSHATRIERLEKLLRELAGKVKEVSDSAEERAPGDVRPPHW